MAALRCTVGPDTAATEAADAEHTLAAEIANSETQSIRAWSQASADDTEIAEAPGRRSWKVPVAVATVAAAAAVVAGVVQLWPHHSTPKTPAAVAAPPEVKTQSAAPALAPADKTFIDSLNAYGLSGKTDKRGPAQYQAEMIAFGRSMCRLLTDDGLTLDQVVQAAYEKSPALTEVQAHVVVDYAIAAYCPQYAQR